MKKLVSLMLAVCILAVSSVCVFAVDTDSVETGKTVVTFGDWVYEKINNDTQWELDEYVGFGGKVIVPRFLENMLIVSLGDHCFMNNSDVTSVFTSSPLWTIGEYAFIDCTSLESVELNFALHTIGVGAFSGTSSLKSINLEDSIVSEIKPYTFLNSGIEVVKLPSTCTKIGERAFAQCDYLKEITIPETVTEIDSSAFNSDDGITIKCYMDSYAEQYAKDNGINFEILDPLKGDADGNRVVNISDATAIQKYKAGLSELTSYGLKAADVNGDGSVTVRDATLIQMRIAGIIDEF